MTTIVIDGLNEEDFRRSIENRLREDRAGAAIARLRGLLAPYAGPGRILPERFLTVEATDLTLSGWDALGTAVCQHDRPGRPVTALSIAFGWPGEEGPQPDAAGRFRPHVETSYFTDDAFPFSQCGREDLLEGYSYYGCNWAGDHEATDAALSLDGIDDLHSALAKLEAQLLASTAPDEDGIRAGSLASCLLSALLFQAVSEQIGRNGLPRPLCVTAGSNGVYPYFDAPVAGMPAAALEVAEAQAEVVEASQEVPAPRYSSLLMTGIPRARKRAVLVLDESETESADRIARLRTNTGEGSENEATPREATPAAPAPEQPDIPEVACDGPLLAKKPNGKAWDFRDMLSTPAPAQPETQAPPSDHAEAPLPVSRREELPRPGFSLLEPDLPQPLQDRVPIDGPSMAKALARPADQDMSSGGLGRVSNGPVVPVEDGPVTDGSALPAPAGLRSRLRLWFLSPLRGLAHASSAVIALFRKADRGKKPDQHGRKRRMRTR